MRYWLHSAQQAEAKRVIFFKSNDITDNNFVSADAEVEMKLPGLPENEEARLKSLYMIDLLDTRDDERFERLTRISQKLFQVPIAVINLIDRERQWALACQGLAGRELQRDISFCAHAILQDEPLILNDARQDARFSDNPLVTQAPFIRFYAGYPVRLPDGEVAGTLCLAGSEPRDFSAEDIAAMKDIASIVEDEFEVINMAMTDSLTELRNRRGFYNIGEKRFRELQQAGTAFSILYFDLDKFKPINDLWGHAEGDAVLKVFADQLRQLQRPQDVAGRIGGDEFAVLIADSHKAVAFQQKLRDSINAYNASSGKPYNINFSYGVLSSSAGTYGSLMEMIKESDTVMYSEKRRKNPGSTASGPRTPDAS